MLLGFRILLVVCIVLVCFYYLVYKVQERKECLLYDSEEYKKAVLEYKQMQDWFVRTSAKDFVPFQIFVVTGLFSGIEMTIRRGSDGRLVGLDENLSPSEYIAAVNKIKWFLDFKGEKG